METVALTTGRERWQQLYENRGACDRNDGSDYMETVALATGRERWQQLYGNRGKKSYGVMAIVATEATGTITWKPG